MKKIFTLILLCVFFGAVSNSAAQSSYQYTYQYASQSPSGHPSSSNAKEDGAAVALLKFVFVLFLIGAVVLCLKLSLQDKENKIKDKANVKDLFTS